MNLVPDRVGFNSYLQLKILNWIIRTKTVMVKKLYSLLLLNQMEVGVITNETEDWKSYNRYDYIEIPVNDT